jgi:hypothetical protein
MSPHFLYLTLSYYYDYASIASRRIHFMATYNCEDSTNNAYGAGGYGTCAEATTSVGAPNTGLFQQFTSSGSFTIIAPLVVAIVVVVIATVVLRLRKKA